MSILAGTVDLRKGGQATAKRVFSIQCMNPTHDPFEIGQILQDKLQFVSATS
jgi:hypothetical protein